MGIASQIFAYTEPYDVGYGIGEFIGNVLIWGLIILIIAFLVTVVIVRWALRVNARVNLLEGINRKLETLLTLNMPTASHEILEKPAVSPPLSKQKMTMPETPEYFRASCPTCDAAFKVPAKAKGKTATCPKCQKRFRIS